MMKYIHDRRSIPFGRTQAGAAALVAVLGVSAAGGWVKGRQGPAADAPAAAAAWTPASRLAPAEANAVRWDLPNLQHERVDHFVGRFTGAKRADFTRYLERKGRYEGMISARLAARGMPQDLIYLAMIESGFHPTAYSHAAASGLWQFIRGTGERYGLDVNRAVDERNDPVKATDAALDYLEDLHRQFGSWYLAAAAYNTGEGRVARIMRQETGSVKGTDDDYYRIWHRLPRETRDYVPLMVAAARIGKEPARFGFADVAPEAPLAYREVTAEPATPLRELAARHGTTVGAIRELNPQLKMERTRNDASSIIRVPPG